jgi:PhnB protein
MTTVNVYLTFEGNCREAFDFYRSIFGGEFSSRSTFGEMPPQEGMPPMSDELKDQIMHVTLPVSKETVLMGSDSGGWGPKIVPGNNFSISVHVSGKEEADRIFNALVEGGEIRMAMEKTFWNAYFGMLTDKFGINWMVNYTLVG